MFAILPVSRIVQRTVAMLNGRKTNSTSRRNPSESAIPAGLDINEADDETASICTNMSHTPTLFDDDPEMTPQQLAEYFAACNDTTSEIHYYAPSIASTSDLSLAANATATSSERVESTRANTPCLSWNVSSSESTWSLEANFHEDAHETAAAKRVQPKELLRVDVCTAGLGLESLMDVVLQRLEQNPRVIT